MRLTRTFRRTAAVAGTVILLGGGVAASQAIGDGAEPLTRSEALLAAAQAELSRTQRSVDTITLQHVIDGREVYAVTGATTACILVSGIDQPLGRSEGLTCTNSALATPGQPMHTGFPTESGGGYVDLVWVGDAAPAQVSTSGAPVRVAVGSEVVSATRVDDSAASELKWQAPAAGPVEVELQPRAERVAKENVTLR